MDENNGGSQPTPTPTPTSTATPTPSPTPTPTPTPTPEPSPPYSFKFARAAIVVASIAYVATLLALIIFTKEVDSAAVTGALGALFTLIGTVSGAYFGIKRSSDTEDKGREAERAANGREQEANKAARDAAGALDSGKWEDLKRRGIL